MGRRRRAIPALGSSETYAIVIRQVGEQVTQQDPISLAELLLHASKKFQEVAPQIEAALKGAQEAFENFLEKNPNFLRQVQRFADEIKHFPERQRQAWITAAEQGWYLNAETPVSMRQAIVGGKDVLDQCMIDHLEEDWKAISENIISSYPERREILECAFQLHLEGRYIAAIPLMLAQADGICAQALGAHLFTDQDDREARLTEMASNADTFTGLLLEILGLKTQFSAGISKHSQARKALAPNRNGILHGSRRHLDYGTKVNSLKTFSLLAFVVFILCQASQADFD